MKSSQKIKTAAAVIGILTCFATAPGLAADAISPAVIPQPHKMAVQPGKFTLTRQTRITADAASRVTADSLAKTLSRSTGYPFKTRTTILGGGKVAQGILLTTQNADKGLGPEGYELTVAPDSIVIRAPAQAGLFYGVQTLLQLLPPEIFSTNVVPRMAWETPCVQINDQPRFQWRGLMLDVSRHFFTKSEVEGLLDAMALHKINIFHWHLVDNNGWRIEIKKYPKLTSEAAWRDGVGWDMATNSTTAYGPDGRYGGFYTQDDIREVVAYAQARHITIVPEIEMPGHSVAALAAYPQFSTDRDSGIYTPANEETFQFLDDVLTEVFQLFPGQYIHIGGDEVPKGPWKNNVACQALMQREGLKNEEELQSWFIRRIETFVNQHGKTLMGWSEILQGGLAKSAVVMDWIGGGQEAASKGHDVVMTPTSAAYFDYYQSDDRTTEPRAIGGYVPLSKVYAFEPIPVGLAPEMQKHILGAQGSVWTEYIANFKHVEYMTFPRLCAMAEVTWSAKDGRDFNDFTQRLRTENRRLDQLGINYRLYQPDNRVRIGDWKPAQIKTEPTPMEWNVTKQLTAAGKARVSLEYSSGAFGINIAWVALLKDGVEISRDVHAGFTGSYPNNPFYTLDVPVPQPGVNYSLRAQINGDGGTDSAGHVFWESRPAASK